MPPLHHLHFACYSSFGVAESEMNSWQTRWNKIKGGDQEEERQGQGWLTIHSTGRSPRLQTSTSFPFSPFFSFFFSFLFFLYPTSSYFFSSPLFFPLLPPCVCPFQLVWTVLYDIAVPPFPTSFLFLLESIYVLHLSIFTQTLEVNSQVHQSHRNTSIASR